MSVSSAFVFSLPAEIQKLTSVFTTVFDPLVDSLNVVLLSTIEILFMLSIGTLYLFAFLIILYCRGIEVLDCILCSMFWPMNYASVLNCHYQTKKASQYCSNTSNNCLRFVIERNSLLF